MTDAYWLIGSLIACLVAVIIILDVQRHRLLRERDHLIQRAKETDKSVVDLATKVIPLVEKTDWMTGRWGGQFDTLVKLEKLRNDKVVVARRALWSIPVVKETIATYGALPTHL